MKFGYEILYVEVNIFSAFLILLVLWRIRENARTSAHIRFVLALLSQIVFFASDTLFVLMDRAVLPRVMPAALFLKGLYFFTTTTTCFFWFLYFESLRKLRFARTRWSWYLSTLNVWLTLLMLLINMKSQILFYYDRFGSYRRGPAFFSLYALAYVYIFVACIRCWESAYREENYAERHNYMVMALFPILPGIGGIVQFYFPKLPVVCALLAMETLIIHLNSMDQTVSLDALTGLNNRKQFLLAVTRKMKNRHQGSKLYILMIDVNRFKSINDTYGYIEGDRALCRMADVLRVAAEDLRHRATVARYGGDEFIILVETEDAAEVTALKERIVRLLAEDVKKHQVPYEMTTSVGIAAGEDGMSIQAMIDAADQKLYEEKKIAHQKDGGGEGRRRRRRR